MSIFAQHIGEVGAARDLLKTIFDGNNLHQFRFEDIANLLEQDSPEDMPLLSQLLGHQRFQIWGIPSGATAVLRKLSDGDCLALVRTVGFHGYLEYCDKVVAHPIGECPSLSRYLWGETRFPLIIFMQGERIDVPWTTFCEYFSYKENWNPAGTTWQIKPEKLQAAGIFSEDAFMMRMSGLAHPDELAAKVKILRRGHVQLPLFREVPALKQRSVVDRFIRDPNVVAWILEQAEGHCESCNAPAPFEGRDHLPFLEVHHVRPLFEGGPDNINNTVALCPNCHRAMHMAHNSSELRSALIERIERLDDYPHSS